MDLQQWKEERKRGIGGSDCAAICGVSPYRTPLEVWQEKRGLAPQEPDNDAMLWGRILEPIVRQRYSDVTGKTVLLPTDILKNDKYPFMLGNIDGFTEDPSGIEIKTAAFPTGWGEPGTDQIPIGYQLQCHHYMIITGFPIFEVPVLIGGRDFRIYHVEADKELQDMIIQREADFWKLVENGTPPPPTTIDDVIRLYRQSKSSTVTATAETEVAVEALRKVREKLSSLESEEEQLKLRILETMKDADTLLGVDGAVIATWKSAKAAMRLDSKALQADHPEIYSKYAKQGEPSRRFLLKS